MSIAFHTVFILNENIKWIEEFIIYYINLGISKFYLYHNESSMGGDGTTSQNKYGFDISTTSSTEELNILNNILDKYREYIVYILWQPKNENNQIVYGQVDSIDDCIKKYGNLHEWICFLDLDEFIFSENNINLVNYLNNLDKSISNVILIQKKFLDRFLSSERYITQEFQCIDKKIGIEWAPKNIIRCKDYISSLNIHCINTKNTTIIANIDDLRFNHYNINDKQLKWMSNFYKTEIPFKINSIDDGMKRYKYLFKC
jgi:hypothetical protein